MQGQCLHVFDGDAAVAVHDRLRETRRPRGEEHVQRVVERHRLERHRRRGGRAVMVEERRPSVLARRVEIGQPHDVVERRQRGDDLCEMSSAVDVLVAVPVPIDGEEHLRFDLGPPIDHGPHAEFGAHDDHTAPRLAVARNATVVSAMFGR